MPHFLPTHAVEVTAAAGRLTYSADSSPERGPVHVRPRDRPAADRGHAAAPRARGPRGHLTPEEAGEHGRRAGARRLVLTHISDELDAEWARAEAERGFGGPVDVAVEGAVYTV